MDPRESCQWQQDEFWTWSLTWTAASDTRCDVYPSDITNRRAHFCGRPLSWAARTNHPAVRTEEQPEESSKETQQNSAWDDWQKQTLTLGRRTGRDATKETGSKSQQQCQREGTGWEKGLDTPSARGEILHIRTISERSCDTENWSNDAENSTLHHWKKLHFKI